MDIENLSQLRDRLDWEENRARYFESGGRARWLLASLVEYAIVLALLSTVVIASFSLELGQ